VACTQRPVPFHETVVCFQCLTDFDYCMLAGFDYFQETWQMQRLSEGTGVELQLY
jgi:hypothetical protein